MEKHVARGLRAHKYIFSPVHRADLSPLSGPRVFGTGRVVLDIRAGDRFFIRIYVPLRVQAAVIFQSRVAAKPK